VIPIQVAPHTHTTQQLIDARHYADTPIWFSGVPFALGDNPLLVPILNGPPEGVAADAGTGTGTGAETDKSGADAFVEAAERGGEGLWAGANLGVVTGFQARTGGRVLWSGGVSVFSDEYASKDIAPCVFPLCPLSLSLYSPVIFFWICE
jgi:oligosaccharyltransferase complex subunit beta